MAAEEGPNTWIRVTHLSDGVTTLSELGPQAGRAGGKAGGDGSCAEGGWMKGGGEDNDAQEGEKYERLDVRLNHSGRVVGP